MTSHGWFFKHFVKLLSRIFIDKITFFRTDVIELDLTPGTNKSLRKMVSKHNVHLGKQYNIISKAATL